MNEFSIREIARQYKKTEETRAEANASVDRAKRYMQILAILDGGDMTAKEVAVEMQKRGFIPTSERNYSAPRLTELEKLGKVQTIGKKKCQYTGKTVAVYRRIRGDVAND